MKTKDLLIRGGRLIYRKLTGKVFFPPMCDCDRQSSNDKIYQLLSTGAPCMIARFGTVEINCISNYLCVHSKKSYLKKIAEYVIDNTHTPWWNTDHFEPMNINAGVFPACLDTAEKFSERYLADIPEIDLLGCHQYYETFMPLREDVIKVQLEMLYPFFVDRPWTRYLKNKKVLVIHPFVETITSQYLKSALLFNNKDILPDFELLTLKAVQSAAGGETEFEDWFEALNHMERMIDGIDFDVAILGCGAYGLPLAAYIKRMGKQSIHLGGGTQLFFGIKGRRWLEDYEGFWHYRSGIDINIDYKLLFNSHWVFPSEKEKPNKSNLVENACYW